MIDLVESLSEEVARNTAVMDPELLKKKDSMGKNLLHYSILSKNGTLARWLIECGFDVDGQTNNGTTPLMIAAKDYNENMVEILLDADANIHIVNKKGKTVFEYINFSSVEKSVTPHLLIDKLTGNCRNPEEISTKLYESKISVYVAIMLNDEYVTESLLKRGLNMNARLGKGATALHLAVYLQDWKSVELLLKYGAEINAEDSYGKTPLAYLPSGHRQIADQLKVLQILLDQGADLTTWARDEYRHMQVYWILRFCSKDIVKKVLQCRRIDWSVKDGRNSTLLHYLAGNVYADVLELLEGWFVDLEVTNDEGCTLLSIAASSGHKTNIQWLLDRGADVNHQNRIGMTPLCNVLLRNSGCANDNIERIELLMQYGADVQMTIHNDSTIVQLAVDLNKLQLIQPILAHLAMMEVCGMSIEERIQAIITTHVQIKNSVDSYKQKIIQIKEIVISKSVTMFELLTMSEKQLLANLRSEQLVSELEEDHFKNNQGVYYRKLRLKIATANRKNKLKLLADITLSTMTNISNLRFQDLIDKIQSFLSQQELLMLGQVSIK